MKFISIVLALIAVALMALFIIKGSDVLLLIAIATIIVGFWIAVFQIPQESDS
jgi:uncharacterized membrane protein YccC